MIYFNCYVKGIKGKVFTYSSTKDIEVGSWVLVSFRKKLEEALIVERTEKPIFDTFDIDKILDAPPISKELITLAQWLSRYYSEDVTSFLPLMFNDNIFKSSKIFLVDKLKSEELTKYFGKKESVNIETLEKYFDLKDINKWLQEGVLSRKSNLREYEKRDISITSNDLNRDQEVVFNKIEKTKNSFFLIRGVTGSGKTEIYVKLIERALERGNGSIFLLPEIALATQIAKRLEKSISNISILHSSINSKKLGEEYLKVINGESQVVLGVRSAIFAPVKNLEYIVIDEEHEDGYKQDTTCSYDARVVAMKRSQIEGCKVVLGSATPSLERYYHATKGRIVLSEIDKRYNDYKMPRVEIIDLKKERDILSKRLIEELKKNKEKGEQSLILINRKGYANSVQCTSCGEVVECKHCSISLVYYKKDNCFRCNYCSFEIREDKQCKGCGVFSLEPIGKGSESLEERLKKELEGFRIVRFDGEVNKKKGEAEKIFESFGNQEYDIIVGTKLIAKGLHFPNITLVAIVDSDSLLHFPDFRSSEKTFQLITQAAGRAGRNGKNSLVLIQTYNPEHYAIANSKGMCYKSFFDEEISYREELGYPPFNKSANIILTNKDEDKAKKLADKIHYMLKKSGVDSYPPIKAPIYKIKDNFRYHIFIKGDKASIDRVKKIVKSDRNIKVDIDPINLL